MPTLTNEYTKLRSLQTDCCQFCNPIETKIPLEEQLKVIDGRATQVISTMRHPLNS